MKTTAEILEFDKIKNLLEEMAYTKKAKEKIQTLSPFLSEQELLHELKETSEARTILDKMGTPPAVTLKDIDELVMMADKGSCLMPQQLEYIGLTLTGVKRLKDFLARCKGMEVSLPYYEMQMDSLEELREEIHTRIRGGRVDDFASPYLKELRSEIERADSKMRQKAEDILRNNKECFSDSFVTIRSGHLCLPVKKEYKFKISGSVIDKSSTGATLFIEPSSVAKLHSELSLLKLEEENEERRILYEISAMAANEIDIFTQNATVIEKLDFIFAKGKLSADMEAIEPMITAQRKIMIKEGRHPFIEKEKCVPLNFELSDNLQGIIITGPNTGGKTVAIKTVGLLSMMAQSGLHVPCKRGEFSLNNQVLCDIGDGQNITENLSTFSAHIINSLEIIKKANEDTLVIMDELGSGTDPTEGMGIAVAILEELRKSGCNFLVTTHYPEVKNYAKNTQGVINAKMAFDKETLKPLYQMEIGQAGESCAFYIAKRLGMKNEMLKTAARAAYGNEELDFLEDTETESKENKEASPTIRRKKEQRVKEVLEEKFAIGDSVMVLPDKKIGIVCQRINDKGVLQVQMPGKKIWINHKRVKLHVKAEQMYPEDYDFSILFDTVENRKARHKMGKRHNEDLEIFIAKE